MVWLLKALKVMVCAVSGAADTVKLRVTVAAAAKVALPAWLAVKVQVPVDTKVKLLPLTVHTPGVVEASATAKFEVELATSAGAAVPSV